MDVVIGLMMLSTASQFYIGMALIGMSSDVQRRLEISGIFSSKFHIGTGLHSLVASQIFADRKTCPLELDGRTELVDAGLGCDLVVARLAWRGFR